MTWLATTPSAVVSALSAMVPRIEASEAESRANVVAVGQGIKPGGWIKRQLQDWRREAEGGESLIKRAPGKQELAALGIKFKKVKRG